MVLSDVDIRRYMEQGKIKVTPDLPPEQFGSCSVDFRLGNEFSIFEHSRHAFIDLRDRTAIQDLMRTVTVPSGEPFILQPGEFALEPQDLLPDLAQLIAQGQRRHDQQATVADCAEACAQLRTALIEIGSESLQMPFLPILACHAVLATRDGDSHMRHDDLP